MQCAVACSWACLPHALGIAGIKERAHNTATETSSYDIAETIRESHTGTEGILVQYLSGYLVDDARDDEDILQVASGVLAYTRVPRIGQRRCSRASHGLPHHTLTGSIDTQGEL